LLFGVYARRGPDANVKNFNKGIAFYQTPGISAATRALYAA
jgi:hypothetical protein